MYVGHIPISPSTQILYIQLQTTTDVIFEYLMMIPRGTEQSPYHLRVNTPFLLYPHMA